MYSKKIRERERDINNIVYDVIQKGDAIGICLDHWLAKFGPLTSSIRITWELIRKVNS